MASIVLLRRRYSTCDADFPHFSLSLCACAWWYNVWQSFFCDVCRCHNMMPAWHDMIDNRRFWLNSVGSIFNDFSSIYIEARRNEHHYTHEKCWIFIKKQTKGFFFYVLLLLLINANERRTGLGSMCVSRILLKLHHRCNLLCMSIARQQQTGIIIRCLKKMKKGSKGNAFFNKRWCRCSLRLKMEPIFYVLEN